MSLLNRNVFSTINTDVLLFAMKKKSHLFVLKRLVDLTLNWNKKVTEKQKFFIEELHPLYCESYR